MEISIVLFISIISLGQSFIFSKHAFDDSACTTLKPRSGTEELTSSPYAIEISSNEYQPEKTISVTIKGIRLTDKFKGFFVQARKDGYLDPYGTWQPSSLVKLRDCKNKNDAISHSDLTDRDSITLTWNPPSTFVGSLRIHVTVMKDKNVYWLNLKSESINWYKDLPTTKSPYSSGQDQQHVIQQVPSGLKHQISHVESFIKSDDPELCITLKPEFGVLPQTSAPPITITTDNQLYQSPNKIKVTLVLKPNAALFTEYILQARAYQSEDFRSIGSFQIAPTLRNAKLVTCQTQDDTFVQKMWEPTRKVEIYWLPPVHYNQKIVFLVTAIQDFFTYWHKIPSNTITFGGQTTSAHHESFEPVGSTSQDYEPPNSLVDEGTCTSPCKRKYPIGTGRGVADLLISVKQTLQKVEQMLQSKCGGPSDCGDIQALGFTKSEVYSITPKGTQESKDVFCDLETDDGGWLVMFRRSGVFDKSFFDKTWQEYKVGFGDLRGNFRLGNELLSHLTKSGKYEARMEVELPNGEIRFAHYSMLSIGDENSKYKFQVGAYNGNTGDVYRQIHSQVFSTKDKDNSGKKCAQTYKRGFWFHPEYCLKLTALPKVEDPGWSKELKIRPVNFKSSPKQQQSSGTPVDCAEVQNRGFTESMVYKIQITKTSEPIDVYCDLTTDGGGWTVIVRRYNKLKATLNVDRDWNDYKVGFGSAEREYRLGNEKISQLTIQKSHQIRFDFKDQQENIVKYAVFNHFSLASEVLKFRITIQDFSGTDTTLQALLQVNHMPFSTKDRNNAGSSENCAQKYGVGYWFTPNHCFPKEFEKLMLIGKVTPYINQSSSFQEQSSSHEYQSSSQYQQSSSPLQQSSQQNVDLFQKPAKLEKIKKYNFVVLKTRPINFKQKLEEVKYGGSKKITATDLPKNCAEIQYKGNENSGVYNIQLLGTTVEVYCDLVTDGGGWVLIKKKSEEDTVDFNKPWSEYQRGFGDKTKSFFLGLEKISALTQHDPSELRLEVELPKGDTKYALYSRFSVGDEKTMYKLKVEVYSGTLFDFMGERNGQSFSTKDKDNDGTSENCALVKGFGGWFGPRVCTFHDSKLDKLVASPVESSETSSWFWKEAVRVETKIRPVTYKSQLCCKA